MCDGSVALRVARKQAELEVTKRHSPSKPTEARKPNEEWRINPCVDGVASSSKDSGSYDAFFPPGFCTLAREPARQSKSAEGCMRPASPKLYEPKLVKKYRELRLMDYRLLESNMVMGPQKAFPEYFPNDWDFDADFKPPKMVSICKEHCGGSRVPGPMFLETKCALADFIAPSYNAGWYLKQHARQPDYCLPARLKRQRCSQLIASWK